MGVTGKKGRDKLQKLGGLKEINKEHGGGPQSNTEGPAQVSQHDSTAGQVNRLILKVV